jgi:isoleucyl-tRNA synthetase
VTAVATAGSAPYKAVVSTGWVVDAEGRAMHKSTGNYIGARDAMNKYGADVLRLWSASVEFTADMRLGEKLLESVSGVYRNLRYRLRMLLGLIDDLAPDDLLALEALEPIDRLARTRLDEVERAIVKAYEAYDLHGVYLALIDFDEELSSFYIDALKEPMYGGARTGRRRRSAQTALFAILRALCALTAPILSFTAEEAWQAVPERLRGDARSVFDLDVPHGAEPPIDQLAMWVRLKKMRAAVAASEGLRDYQLQAHVYAPAALEPALRALGDNLREALMVTALTLEADAEMAADAEPRIVLLPAPGAKCSRCWKTRPLGEDPAHPLLCTPCAETVRALT